MIGNKTKEFHFSDVPISVLDHPGASLEHANVSISMIEESIRTRFPDGFPGFPDGPDREFWLPERMNDLFVSFAEAEEGAKPFFDLAVESLSPPYSHIQLRYDKWIINARALSVEVQWVFSQNRGYTIHFAPVFV